MGNNVILEGHTWTFWLGQYKRACTRALTHYNYNSIVKMRASPLTSL